MARIAGVPPEQARGFARIVYRMTRKMVGKVVEPIAIAAHHPTILKGYAGYEFFLSRARRVDVKLKALAQIKAAALIGCPF